MFRNGLCQEIPRSVLGNAFQHLDGGFTGSVRSADALTIIEDAAGRTYDEDMRTEEVEAALIYLRSTAINVGGYLRFWDALFIEEPARRFAAAEAALRAICRVGE